MQAQDKILPLFLNTDSAHETLKPNESPYIKDAGWDINGNPALGLGTDNGTGEGQNFLVLSPGRSNISIPNVLLPDGYNKNIGNFYSEVTQETFCFNFNINGNHGIYSVDGNELTWTKIIIDPELNFRDDQEAFIADHRVKLRTVTDKNGVVVEKFLTWTDSKNWQGFINVMAAIKTDGFNASLFHYWKLQPPHFDRREYLELAVRPPMYKPTAVAIPNTNNDTGKINRLIDKAFQFAYDKVNTDGRYTTLSPYSLPLIIKSEDFLNNPDQLPKNGKITMDAGSPLTEKIRIYVRQCGGDWFLYDTIYKYSTCGLSPNEILGTDYWLRTNPWTNYNYNAILNTIDYIFDFSKVSEIIDQPNALRLQNDLPQLSVGMTDLGDSIAFGDNRYGYPNFGCEITNNIDIVVQEKDTSGCNVPIRKIRLYAYIGRCADSFDFCSQVSFFLGSDTAVRFGGMDFGSGSIAFDQTETTTFDLNFADRKSLRCYLKGTPYFSDGVFYQVAPNFSLSKVSAAPYDLTINESKTAIQTIFDSGSYFVCVFDFIVPAGKYIATLGRHNVASTADYRNTSTYILGLANSRSTTIISGNNTSLVPSTSIVTFSKEMELDCTGSDIDVWGNGHDLFYVYCPYITQQGNKKFRFIEGYFFESVNDPLPLESFAYTMNHGDLDNGGMVTDKNGFYFAYTKASNADVVDIEFNQTKLNCTYPIDFTIVTSRSGIGWCPNSPAYLTDYNSGVVGDCNRIVVSGKITNLDGTIDYSGISVSIVGGNTVISRQDGTFTLIVHNGQQGNRVNNIYINAGGSYIITTANCGNIPLFIFDESLSPCVNCQVRNFPQPINLAINIQNTSQTSLKEGGKYSVGCYGADLAGRLMFVNVIKDVAVPSFLERDDVKATFFQSVISNTLNFSAYPDIKWFTFSISKNLGVLKYIQWVGDSINFIDSNGNVVNDPNTAVFVSIAIDSLYNYNIARNFTTLSNYQFVTGDRLRILDDGSGHLLDVATNGDPIDVQILGTNYNQAAVNAGILPTTAVENPSQATIANNKSITLIVRYDSRLNKVFNKTGFWIEIYTPAQESQTIPYCEVAGFWPIINNRIATFTGYDTNNVPLYNFPATIDLDFWDTYFLSRNIPIPNVGLEFFNHPFESANISDNWGANCSSCGRQYVKNDNARQQWYPLDVIKGDNFVADGVLNGIGVFRSENRKQFKESFSWGGIVAMKTQGSIVMFLCENNWFTTNFNFQYIFANAEGVQVANLDDKLSEPHQKLGSEYGVDFEDTSSILFYDKYAFWYDSKNESFVLCDYRNAMDITEFNQQTGAQGYVKSYFISKTKFIKSWNQGVGKEKRFDVLTGIDMDRNNVYVSFRPRRNNSNKLSSYVNDRFNWDLKHQETIVFNIPTGRWVRSVGFVPESYAILKGDKSGVQLLSFAAGKPYYHNSGNDSFAEYYGQQVTPNFIGVLNKAPDVNKILQSISIDSNPYCFWVDLIYSNFYNSYSYLSLNQFKKKENLFYAAVLRNLNSYPSNQPEDLFRSNLFDGGRTYGLYFVIRFIMDLNNLNKYNEMKGCSFLFTTSGNLKK